MNYLFPFNKVRSNDNIIIWGFGCVGKEYYKQLIKLNYCKNIYVCDKNFSSKINLPRISVDKISSVEFDKIIIAIKSDIVARDVIRECQEIGINKNKIIWDVREINEEEIDIFYCQNKLKKVLEKYMDIGLGEFEEYFSGVIRSISKLSVREKKKLIEIINGYELDSDESYIIILRILLMADCFNADLLKKYMLYIGSMDNPELGICLMYRIVWKELTHPEYRYKDYYNDRRIVLSSLSEKILANRTIKKHVTNGKINKVLILRLNFPDYDKSNATRRNVTIANEFARRGIETKFVVLDFLHNPNVYDFINFTYSFESSVAGRNHLVEDVELVYAKGGSISEKALNVIDVIEDFDPDLVIDSCADYDFLTRIIYKSYPVIQIPCRGVNSCTFMHRCLVSSKEIFEDEWNMFHSFDKEKAFFISKYIKSVNESEYIGEVGYEREELGITKDVFLVASIGTRVGMEVTKDMCTEIVNMLDNNPKITWILIGNGPYDSIIDKYSSYIDEKRIILYGYENNLDTIFKRLDIKLLVMPNVMGNGGCVAKALCNSVPVLINTNNGDTTTIIGKERTVKGGYKELAERIQFYYNNQNELLKASKDAREIFDNLPSEEQYIDAIIDLGLEIEI